MKFPSLYCATVLGLFALATPSSYGISILGTETLTKLNLLFDVETLNGNALPGALWSSKTSNYQDNDTDVMKRLKYWEVGFKFDTLGQVMTVTALHLVDPHVPAPDQGGLFTWTAILPPATKEKMISGFPTGQFSGSTSFADKKEHNDSQGNHSDGYSVTLTHVVHQADPGTTVIKDHLLLDLTGEHHSYSVPEVGHTLTLLGLAFASLAGFSHHRRQLRAASTPTPRG